MKMFIVLFSCIGLLTGCIQKLSGQTGETKKSEYRKISAVEARKMMQESKDYILLDVRTESEYREKHIQGAVLIPDNEIKARAEKELPDKNAVILVYCRSGRRSASASKILAGLGYINIYDFGGITGWSFETVSGR